MGLVYARELPRTFKKSKAVDWDQVVSTANRIANQHGMTHPIMTAFEDPPEEGYLDNLGVSQEEMGIVIDTTKNWFDGGGNHFSIQLNQIQLNL